MLSTVTTYLKDAVYGQAHMTGAPAGHDNLWAHSGSINAGETRQIPPLRRRFLTLGGSLCRSELLFCLLERCVEKELKFVDVGSAGLVRRHSSCFPLLFSINPLL